MAKEVFAKGDRITILTTHENQSELRCNYERQDPNGVYVKNYDNLLQFYPWSNIVAISEIRTKSEAV